jgi:hypothetical protein
MKRNQNSIHQSAYYLDSHASLLNLAVYKKCRATWQYTLLSMAIDPLIFIVFSQIALPNQLSASYHTITTLLYLSVAISLVGLFRNSAVHWIFELKREGKRYAPTLSALLLISMTLTTILKTNILEGLYQLSATTQAALIALLVGMGIVILKYSMKSRIIDLISRYYTNALRVNSLKMLEAQSQELQLLWIAPIVSARLSALLAQAVIVAATAPLLWYLPCVLFTIVILHETQPTPAQFLKSCNSCGRIIPYLGVHSDHCIDCRVRRSPPAITHEGLVKAKRKSNKALSLIKIIHHWLAQLK